MIIAQLLMVAPVKIDRRYVGAVAPLAQVWAGLGAVALAERLRHTGRRAARLGRSIALQLAVLGMLISALACYSLLGRNQGVRHSELRPLAEAALRLYGPGQLFLAATPEVPYYARGRLYGASSLREESTDLSARELARLLRESSARLIVIRPAKPWCSWLLRRITTGQLPPGAMVAASSRGGAVAYLIDAERLRPAIAGEGAPSAP